MANSKKHQALIDDIQKKFRKTRDAWADQHTTMDDDMRFENGEQWDKKSLQDRSGRPSLVINKVSGLCKQIIGDVRQNKPGINVRPVDDGADPKTAQVLTGLIRNIENVSDAETCYDTAFDGSIRGGLGFWRVITDYSNDDTFDQDILIKRIVNPFTVLFDPAAEEITFEDARFCFIVSDMPKDEFEKQYPDEYQVMIDDAQFGAQDSRGSMAGWLTENTVKIAEYWYKKRASKTLCLLPDGRTICKEDLTPEDQELIKPAVIKERKVEHDEIWWCLTNGHSILEGPVKWPGKFIPVVPCCGEEIWINNTRELRSVIKWAKDPQRLYNWSRSNTCETLALAPKQPFLVTQEQIEGHENQWKEHYRKPMPYLLYNNDGKGPPQRQMGAIPDTGNLQESMQASDDIKAVTGIYDASLGARSNETSGVAIIARQREGDNSTFTFVDNLNKAIAHTGRILVDLIPRIYDTERVVRLLNPDGSEGWAKINQDMPNGGKALDVSLGKYDVVLESGPGYLTKRIEAANAMAQLLQYIPMAAPVIAPRLAKNLDWPESQEIAEELKQVFAPPPPPPPNPEDKIDMRNKVLTAEKKELDIEGKQMQNAKDGLEFAERVGGPPPRQGEY
jgi:hypothetical protein